MSVTLPSFRPRVALAGKRVLVVEDEFLVALLIEEELLQAGARVLGPVASVRNALDLLEGALADGGINVAVLDLNLAGEQVTPVADVLAEHGIPFVIATGYDDGPDSGRHRAAPILHKPFDPHRLITTIESLVANGG